MKNRLIPQVKEWFPNDEVFIYMQDGAPFHTTKRVKEFLVQKNIKFLPWPGNSSNVNPIENIRELVKREIVKQTITTKRRLIENPIIIIQEYMK